MENDELGESRTTLRRTCGILGPCPLLREKPIIIIIIILGSNLELTSEVTEKKDVK